VLSTLIGEEATFRSERALQRRIRLARLPKAKTLTEYDFLFPKRIAKQKILRLFDCQFIDSYRCGGVYRADRNGENAPADGVGLHGL